VTDQTQFYIQRLGTLRSNRGNFNSQWEEAAARVIPSHRDSFQSYGATNALGSTGQKKTEDQFDSTAAFACQRFASVIESLVTPQSGQWHRLTPVDKMLKRNRAVRMFFDDVNDALFAYRNRPVANFVSNSQQAYLSLGGYGNGIVYVDRPDQTPGLRYRNIHLGEAYFVENHAGIVDTLYRAFWMTARQIVQRFGAAAPEEVQAAAGQATQTERKFEILHVVEPREDHNPTRVDSLGKKFRSCYLLVEKKEILREGGYDSFPYAVARYTQAAGEVYGRGPAQWVLPAIKVLNEEKKTVLKQGHRVVDPAYLSFDDGNIGAMELKAGKLNIGGVSQEGRLLVQPLPVGRIDIGDKLMDMERNVINDAFLVTLFQILVDTPQMTATEVLERAREKGMLLAPTAGRMQAEFLGPMIEREIDLLAQQNLLPPIPPMLRGVDIEFKIEYDNPMSRMQRSEKAAGFMRALDVAANYAKNTMDPAPLDWFDFDSAMPEILDIQGAPVAWTRTQDAVDQIRQSRIEQQKQQAMIQAAPGMAAVAKAIPGMTGK
jgi:hypothetical protein